MPQPNLRYHFDNLDELVKIHDPKIVERAAKSTISKLTSKARTALSKAARQRYNIAAAVIARHANLEKFFQNPTKPFSVIRYVGSKIGLINFGARVRNVSAVSKKTGKKIKRKGVTVKVLRGGSRKRIMSKKGFLGFVAVGENGNKHVFARTSDDKEERTKIEALKGPSVAEMIGKAEVAEALNNVLETAPEQFDHEMEHFLLRQVGLR